MKWGKNQIIGFIVRTLLVLLVLGGIYAFYYTQNKPRTVSAPSGPSKASVRSKLTEHRLAINGLVNKDPSDPAISENLESIRGRVDSTREDYVKELSAFLKNNPKPSDNDYELFISIEKDILKGYDAKYLEVNKLLKYKPITDFGSLDPNKDKQEILTRLNNAINYINKISQNNSVTSQDTISQLKNSTNCLEDLRRSVNEQKNDQYKSLVEQCNAKYTNAKKLVAKDLISYFDNTQTKDLLEITRNLIVRLG